MSGVEIRNRMIICSLFSFLFFSGAYLKQKAAVTESMLIQNESVIQKSETDLPPRVAITFDDGPHPVYTGRLLEGLKKRGVKATFFVVGENIQGNEKLLKEMQEDGHLIGNHTYDHADISKLSDEKACEELNKTNHLIEAVTGEKPAYVRPPFGKWKQSVDCLVPMIAVKWTVDPLDWNTRNVSEVVNKVVTQTEDNDIILLHDCYDTSVEAAFQIIDNLQKKGFVFVTVEELLLE